MKRYPRCNVRVRNIYGTRRNPRPMTVSPTTAKSVFHFLGFTFYVVHHGRCSTIQTTPVPSADKTTSARLSVCSSRRLHRPHRTKLRRKTATTPICLLFIAITAHSIRIQSAVVTEECSTHSIPTRFLLAVFGNWYLESRPSLSKAQDHQHHQQQREGGCTTPSLCCLPGHHLLSREGVDTTIKHSNHNNNSIFSRTRPGILEVWHADKSISANSDLIGVVRYRVTASYQNTFFQYYSSYTT